MSIDPRASSAAFQTVENTNPPRVIDIRSTSAVTNLIPRGPAIQITGCTDPKREAETVMLFPPKLL